MTVELLTQSAAQLGRGLELANLARSGGVVEARVVSMGKDGTARLLLLGQTIDVSTPYALQAGTSVSVSVVREGGTLKLVLQQDAQAVSQQTASASLPIPVDDPDALLPEAVKSALVRTLLESTLNSQAASTGQAATQAQSPATAAQQASSAPEAQTQAAVQTQPGLETSLKVPGSGASSPPPETQAQSAVQTRQGLETISQASGNPQSASPAVSPGTQAAVQNTAQAIWIPFQPPQFAQPLMLKVEQGQEDGSAESGGQQDKRIWNVSVSLDAGALGLVHVAIGLRRDAISVRLSATDAQGAAQLSAWLPELKTSLERADFVTGELSAAQALPAHTAGQGRSRTV